MLATSHESFANSMKRTLDKGNSEFLDAMSRATKMLREAISELESSLGGAMPRASVRAR